MHKSSARQLLTSTKRYACPSCVVKSSIALAARESQQIRCYSQPHLRSPISDRLREQVSDTEASAIKSIVNSHKDGKIITGEKSSVQDNSKSSSNSGESNSAPTASDIPKKARIKSPPIKRNSKLPRRLRKRAVKGLSAGRKALATRKKPSRGVSTEESEILADGSADISSKKAVGSDKTKNETDISDKKIDTKGVKEPANNIAEEKEKKSPTVKVKKVISKKPKKKEIQIETLNSSNQILTPIDSDQPPVPTLAYGLDRVLFNPGVYQLQDPRTKVYNFDPYLQTIMPVAEFDFNSLKQYITSSRDQALEDVAKSLGKKYIGSTSSMTSTLSHFHYLLSRWRPINANTLSRSFPDALESFTLLSRAPSAIFLKWQDGTYAIDADKEFASANILSMLGKSMEKLLTLDTPEFERYRRSSADKLSEEEIEAPEAYHYTTLGDFLMRSQLDAYDPRLPGTGMFDLKTRAVVSIRMNVQDYKNLKGYEIIERFGEFESYEREYFDMIRAAFLKYSLQVRMGRMDGIFVAFHNTERIFGFQYIPLSEMDYAIHGQADTTLGDEEFKHSISLLNKVLNKATEKFPGQCVRLHFETRDAVVPFMYIFAEPVTEEQMEELQSKNDDKISAFEREALAMDVGDEKEEKSSKAVDQWEAINEQINLSMDQDESGEGMIVKSGQRASSEFREPEIPEESDHLEHTTSNTSLSDANIEPETEGELQYPEVSPEIFASDTSSYEPLSWGVAIDEQIPSSSADRSLDVDALEDSTEATSEGVSLENMFDTLDSAMLADQVPDQPSAFGGVSMDTILTGSSIYEEPESDEKDWKRERANKDNAATPLLAMTLTIRNKFGSEYVDRPVNRTAAAASRKPWEVEFSLAEIQDHDRAWTLYMMCQKRREKNLVSEEDDKYKQPYLRQLREMSLKRAKVRNQQEKETKEQSPIVLGRDVSS